MEDYLAEQGLEDCPGTPDAYCRGRILTRAAAACAGQAYAEQADEGFVFDRVDGLAFVEDSVTDEVGLAWVFWVNFSEDVQGQTAMWADSGAPLVGLETENLEIGDIF